MSDEVRHQNDVFKVDAQHTHTMLAPPTVTSSAMPDQFDIPIDSIPLPSLGVCYPMTSTLYGKERIDVKAMTAKEEDILTSRALLKNGTVITHLLRSCIVENGINPDEMLTGDRTALMIALRITGYGSDYKLEVQCPACEEKQKFTFELAGLPVKFLEIQPIAQGVNEFELIMPVRRNKITYRFLTGADEAELLQDRQSRKKKLGTQVDTAITSNLLRQIVSVDGKYDRGLIARYVNSMPARDSRFLRKTISETEPGMEMRAEMKCSACGEVSEVDVPIGASFFWPDA